MSIVRKVKNLIRSSDDPNTYECSECGNEFESHMSDESAWLSCPDCDSKEIEITDAGG